MSTSENHVPDWVTAQPERPTLEAIIDESGAERTCTIFPADSEGSDTMTHWVTAVGDASFTDLEASQ